MIPFLLHFALLLLCSGIAFVWLLRKHRKYWHSRCIPTPTPKLINGNIGSLFGARPGVFQLRDWTNQYGKVYGIQYGWRNALVISDPAMAHDLLVTKFEYFHERNTPPHIGNIDNNKWIDMFFARGSRWKRLRAIANPAFTVTNLKKSIVLMDDSIKNAIDFLEEARAGGKAINIHRHFVEMAFDVIARVALGQRESRQFNTEKASLAMNAMLRVNTTAFDYIAWTLPWLGTHFVRPFMEWSELMRNDPLGMLKKHLVDELHQRRRQHQQQQQSERGGAQAQMAQKSAVDFIDMFLDMEFEQQQQPKQQDGLFNSKTALSVEKTNTPEEIVMQLLLFLLAGFDTTANSLSVISHNLALHPEVQVKLQDEIALICIDEDPTYEQLSQLKYTEAVVKETLRLCPVAANVVNRICSQTTTLGNITVEKGTALILDVISLQRDKHLWGEDAAEFRPERWLEQGRQLPAFYFFGGGPRICIGMRFAMLEEKLALVRILRKYSIVRCAETEEELHFTGQVVLTPKSVTVGLKLTEEQ